ncbi:hypothetical protein D3C74_425380 [compost metagenome]
MDSQSRYHQLICPDPVGPVLHERLLNPGIQSFYRFISCLNHIHRTLNPRIRRTFALPTQQFCGEPSIPTTKVQYILAGYISDQLQHHRLFQCIIGVLLPLATFHILLEIRLIIVKV